MPRAPVPAVNVITRQRNNKHSEDGDGLAAQAKGVAYVMSQNRVLKLGSLNGISTMAKWGHRPWARATANAIRSIERAHTMEGRAFVRLDSAARCWLRHSARSVNPRGYVVPNVRAESAVADARESAFGCGGASCCRLQRDVGTSGDPVAHGTVVRGGGRQAIAVPTRRLRNVWAHQVALPS
jgi:hypothetical protein